MRVRQSSKDSVISKELNWRSTCSCWSMVRTTPVLRYSPVWPRLGQLVVRSWAGRRMVTWGQFSSQGWQIPQLYLRSIPLAETRLFPMHGEQFAGNHPDSQQSISWHSSLRNTAIGRHDIVRWREPSRGVRGRREPQRQTRYASFHAGIGGPFAPGFVLTLATYHPDRNPSVPRPHRRRAASRVCGQRGGRCRCRGRALRWVPLEGGGAATGGEAGRVRRAPAVGASDSSAAPDRAAAPAHTPRRGRPAPASGPAGGQARPCLPGPHGPPMIVRMRLR